MAIQLFWIIFLCNVVNNVECTANKPDIVHPHKQMSIEKAIAKCTQKGSSLANYASVKANPAAPSYLNQLVDGESAWIKGFAELSPFLAWYGCFNATAYIRHNTRIRSFAIARESLFLCSQSCLRTYVSKSIYIGIKNKSCYCIDFQHMDDEQRQEIRFAGVNDSLCSLPCENNIVDSCGGQSVVSVYDIIEPGRMRWALNEPSKRQCVYAKKHEERFELHTASCHTLRSVKINGYICMNSASSGSVLTSTCPKYDSAGASCIVHIPSYRQEAYTSCTERRGKLADIRSEGAVGPKMITNHKYWISVYRTFEISERYIANETICLAAVRVNNTLYLELDDCSEEKYYLCEQKIITHSSQYPNITSNTNPFITVLATTGAVSIATKTPDTGYVPPLAYVIPSILTLLFLVIIIIVFVLYRKRKTHANRLPYQSDNTYLTPQHGIINDINSQGRIDDDALQVEGMAQGDNMTYTELPEVRNDPEYNELVNTAINEPEYLELH